MSLSNLLVGYRPLIDRDRRIMALQVQLAAVDGELTSMSSLYGLVADDRPLQSHTLILSAPDAVFDDGLMALEPMPGLWLEVPAEVAANPAYRPMLLLLHEQGMGMVLQGVPPDDLPDELLAVFRLSMVDARDERRGSGESSTLRARVRRSVATVQSGVNTPQAMEQAFAAGAYATCGWLIPEMQASDELVTGTDYLGVLQLMEMIEREASLREIEAAIRQEPELALRLLRHIDSVGFGLSVPVQNFQHAVMFLGYQGMSRWLALMLVSVNPDASRRPLMLASFRRGLILENLAGREADSEVREEMFLLGVFSLLDRALGQPFETLLSHVPVPERVAEALVGRTGPYLPLLDIVEAIEHGPTPEILGHLERCHIGLEECNRVTLATLRVAAV
ncbi:MAG: HDOD domain-containing protein [Lautropia sp.]|nr:HDOD domain-containing protein [Lautropia sp.]